MSNRKSEIQLYSNRISLLCFFLPSPQNRDKVLHLIFLSQCFMQDIFLTSFRTVFQYASSIFLSKTFSLRPKLRFQCKEGIIRIILSAVHPESVYYIQKKCLASKTNQMIFPKDIQEFVISRVENPEPVLSLLPKTAILKI